MDDSSAARRANFGIVKDEKRTSSGVVPAGLDTSSAFIAVGTVLDARYLVGRAIGAGATGIVFEARNIETDAKVAIKCPRRVDDDSVARFTREAKGAASIKSDYACAVHDVGSTHEGVPYLAMEFVAGPNVGTIVEESGPFGPRTAVEYTLQACEALAVAHVRGIVHGAVSPANLLLSERAGGMRTVKVADFGVSKIVDAPPEANPTGSARCMSPEQVRHEELDVRSDVWSLGTLLYQLLTGRPPLGGVSMAELRSAILEKPAAPLSAFRSDLPSGLGDVLAKCLEKDPAHRYQTLADLTIALAPFAPKRTRNNVDRVVAILQGREPDPEIRMASTTPPPGVEALLSSEALPPPAERLGAPTIEAPTPIEALMPLEALTHGSVAAPIAEVLAEISRSDAVPTPRPGSLPAAKVAPQVTANTVVTPIVPVSPAAIAAASREADADDDSVAPPPAISSEALVSAVVVPSTVTRQKPLLIAAAAGLLVLAVIGLVVFSGPSASDASKAPAVITTTRAEPKLEPPAQASEPAVTVNVVRPEAPPPPRPSAPPPPAVQTFLPPPAPRPPPAASSAAEAPSANAPAPEPSTTAKPPESEEAAKPEKPEKPEDGERAE